MRHQFSMSRRGFLVGWSALAVGLLGACTPSPPKNRPSPVLTFVGRRPVTLRAERLEIREDWRSPMTPQNVEHLMPLSPMQAVRRWSDERLRVSGDRGAFARLAILDASVTEKRLPVQSGFSGAFKSEQSERFDATLEVVLEIIDTSTGVTAAQASARVTRFTTLAEDASINDRDATWISLVENLMLEFDGHMSDAINAYLSAYIAA